MSATKPTWSMFEGAAKEISEADFTAALKFAQEVIQPMIAAQKELAAKAGKRNASSRLTSFPTKFSTKPRRSPATALCPRCSRPASSPREPAVQRHQG